MYEIYGFVITFVYIIEAPNKNLFFPLTMIVRFRAMEGPNACTHVRVAVYANKP